MSARSPLHRVMRQTFVSVLVLFVGSFFIQTAARAQSDVSIAQEWNELLLFSITNDFARPPIHARNLFHIGIGMYDAWAAYDQTAEPYLLGRTRGSYTSPFNGVKIPDDAEELEAARREAVSFVAFRFLLHRFQNAPGAFLIFSNANQKMDQLGYNRFNTSTAYVNGGPAELGNYIAQQIINFGFTDGSNESADYANQVYQPLNGNILPEEPGPGDITDPNRWQAISLTVTIDQSGNVISDPPHLAPEWGDVLPFSMTPDDRVELERDGHSWKVYFDPGPPPFIDVNDPSGLESLYKWNFVMVSIWQSHLDPEDETIWDISPATRGNIQDLPLTLEEHVDFYNYFDGGSQEVGHPVNPVTGQPYEPQLVKRGDYARILAEFWADGLDSETPPGHWFKIYNEIRQHPLWENKWMGTGPELDQLEYDVKAYLTIGGSMHDAAVAAWSIKGYYDYVRPVSALRYMCDMGQCTDPMLPNYHPAGMPLIPGYVEVVEVGDPLAGPLNEHVGKIKLYTWQGPDYIDDPEEDVAGVGWILGENWWPYQRPSFVTPPFAAYISGHSTYSRVAAEVFTLFTGSEYFPGGMSNFVAEQNEFLEFEAGPSEEVILQWATYRDASDECSLSRIWGGIHPPADDIPGRLIGIELGPQAVEHANALFNTDRPIVESITVTPNTLNIESIGSSFTSVITFDRQMNVNVIPSITFLGQDPLLQGVISVTEVGWINSTQYEINYELEDFEVELGEIFLRIAMAQDIEGVVQNVYLEARPFTIDTKRPEITETNVNAAVVNDEVAAQDGLVLTFSFSEPCDPMAVPQFELLATEELESTFIFNENSSSWLEADTYQAVFTVVDNDEEIETITVQISGVLDLSGNEMELFTSMPLFSVDTRNPSLLDVQVNTSMLNVSTVGSNALSISLTFDEPMLTDVNPELLYIADNPVGSALVLNVFNSGWQDSFTYTAVYNQQISAVEFDDIQIQLSNVFDQAGNAPENAFVENAFSIDTQRPIVEEVNPLGVVVADSDVNDGAFEVDITFGEPMDQSQLVLVQLTGAPNINQSLAYNPVISSWVSNDTFRASFNANDQNVELGPIDMTVSFGADLAGNVQQPYTVANWVTIDTRNPEVVSLFANTYLVQSNHIGDGGFSVLVLFDEAMDTDEDPELAFDADEDLSEVLTMNALLSGWVNAFTYQAFYDVANTAFEADFVALSVNAATDIAGNLMVSEAFMNLFGISITPVSVSEINDGPVMTVFPNPIRRGQNLNVQIHQTYHDAVVECIGIDGRSVSRMEHNTLQPGMYTIDTANLSNGMYFVVLSTKNKRHVEKVVVAD